MYKNKSSNQKKTGSRRPPKGNRRKRGIPRAPNPGNGGRPTLVLKGHLMLDGSINTATSFVKQVNITPYLGIFPTIL